MTRSHVERRAWPGRRCSSWSGATRFSTPGTGRRNSCGLLVALRYWPRRPRFGPCSVGGTARGRPPRSSWSPAAGTQSSGPVGTCRSWKRFPPGPAFVPSVTAQSAHRRRPGGPRSPRSSGPTDPTRAPADHTARRLVGPDLDRSRPMVGCAEMARGVRPQGDDNSGIRDTISATHTGSDRLVAVRHNGDGRCCLQVCVPENSPEGVH